MLNKPEITPGKTGKAKDAAGAVSRSSAAARGRMGVTIASSLKFEGVSHAYGDHQTLESISLDIKAGEVVCLLGPSGSGKTTLLRLAAGLIPPEEGEILMNHQVVSRPGKMVPPEKRGVGLVFQDYALFPHLTIQENVEFGLTAMDAAERRPYALFMLRTVGLEEKADRYPHHLSGGEQQRVALARALAPKPGILLMDEPFSGLDGRLRESVRSETLAILRETRSTVIVVTHDPEEALAISDRIALMEKGRLVQFGSCDDLYLRPASLFAARFFSEVNQFPATLSDGIVDTPVGSFRYRGIAAIADGAVTVCLRPSDIGLAPCQQSPRRRKSDGGRALKKAYVRSRRPVGEYEHVEVFIPEGEVRVQAKVPRGLLEAHIREVEITLDAEKALVFPA